MVGRGVSCLVVRILLRGYDSLVEVTPGSSLLGSSPKKPFICIVSSALGQKATLTTRAYTGLARTKFVRTGV